MDVYGNSTSNSFTGDVNIDGTINASVATLDNLIVSDSASISTLITIVELETKDPLVTLAVGNSSDSINLGVVEEFTDGSVKWSGLIRDRISKDHYLLAAETTKPNPTSAMPASNTLLGSLQANNITAQQVTSKTGIVVGEAPTGFTIDSVAGTNGQVLSIQNGVTQWITGGGGGGGSTIQAAYDLSTAPQIVTTAVNQTLLLKQGLAQSSNLFEIRDSADLRRIGFDATGVIDISGVSPVIQLKNNLGVKKWSIVKSQINDQYELLNETDAVAQIVRQSGDSSFVVNGNERLNITTSGITVLGVTTVDTLESTDITTKNVSFKNNSGDNRFTQEWDAADKLITRGAISTPLWSIHQDGTSVFDVGGIERARISSLGIKTSDWIIANSHILYNSVDDFNPWVITSLPTTYEMVMRNSLNAIVQEIKQTGEQKFNVGGAESLSISGDGLIMANAKKVSSFVTEYRADVPALPASTSWVTDPVYTGEVVFSLNDTLVAFLQTPTRRLVVSNEYFILNQIPLFASVSLEYQITNVVANDMMIGVQFSNGTEARTGSLVGRSTSQYYMLITKTGFTSYIVEGGVDTTPSVPNLILTGSDYACTVTRTAQTQWTVSFSQGVTNVSTTIILDGAEFGSKHCHFIVADRSNVVSGFDMTIQSVSSPGYGVAQELYTMEQKNNKLTVLDEDAIELMTISNNVVKINTPLSIQDVNTNNIDSNLIKQNKSSFKGLAPSAAQLINGGWSTNQTYYNTVISGVNNKNVNFPFDPAKRSAVSEFWFKPNDIKVGGFCEFVVQIVNSDHFTTLGLLFLDKTNTFFGNDHFNSQNHWFCLFGGGAGVDFLYKQGQFFMNSTININPAPGSLLRSRVTRFSETEWRVSYGLSGLYTTDIMSFGTELANKFVYSTAAMYRVIAGYAVYNMTGFEYNLWEPGLNEYSLSQSAENDLLIEDNAGVALVRINPNDFDVTSTVTTSRSLTINKGKFNSGCSVSGMFYQAIICPNITGITPIPMHTSSVAAFGDIIVPPLKAGNIVRVRMSGIIKTGGSDEYLLVKCYWGDPGLGGVLLAESDPTAKVLKDIASLYWELEYSVIAVNTNFLNGQINLRSYGAYKYNASLTNQKTWEAASIIDSGLTIPVNNVPTPLVLTGNWNIANAAFNVEILNCNYSFEGFNL